MGLRFDLTVPFARFAAQYINELGTPFKRYAMGPVWRGERPGQGRYREFWQCDFDTIGTTSNAADIETALVINDLFTAIGFDGFEIRINNRLLLNGLLELYGHRRQGCARCFGPSTSSPRSAARRCHRGNGPTEAGRDRRSGRAQC